MRRCPGNPGEGLHQRERGSIDPVPARDVIEHAKPEVCRHLGIRQCTVKATAPGELPVFNQRAELVTGRLRIETPGHQHRAGKSPRVLRANAPELGIEETAVERRVVRHQVEVFDKVPEVRHHRAARWCLPDHGIGNPGVTLDEGIDPHPRIHELLETVGYAPVLDAYRADLNGAITPVR